MIKRLFVIVLLIFINHLTYSNDDEIYNIEQVGETTNIFPTIKELRFKYVSLEDTYLVIDRYYCPIMLNQGLNKAENSYLIEGNIVEALYRTQELVHYGNELGYWYFIKIDDIYSSNPCVGWIFGGFAKTFTKQEDAISYSQSLLDGKKQKILDSFKDNRYQYKGLNSLVYVNASKKPVPLYLIPFPTTSKYIVKWLTEDMYLNCSNILSNPLKNDEYASYYRITLQNNVIAWLNVNDAYFNQKSIDDYTNNKASAIMCKGGIINKNCYDCRVLYSTYYPSFSYYNYDVLSDVFCNLAPDLKIHFSEFKKENNMHILNAYFYNGLNNINIDDIEIKKNLEIFFNKDKIELIINNLDLFT